MSFKIKKPVYYVGVQTKSEDGVYHLTLITETDNITQTWKAEADKPPKKFTKDIAEELVICLAMNFRFAVVVYGIDELTGQPFVPHKKKGETK